MSWCLGIEFECLSDSINMEDTNHVEKLLERFNMANCKPKRTPCDLSFIKIEGMDLTDQIILMFAIL